MKNRQGLAGICVCVLLSACGPLPPKRSADTVPAELVPPGFEAKDCHFEPVAQQDSGGLSSMDGATGGGAAAVAAADHGGQTRGHVKCHHTTQILPAITQCFDDNGQEHPVQWCKDREAVRDGAAAKPGG